MARSLLIVLMAVVAVAGPASAQLDAPWLPAVPATVDDSAYAAGVTVACSANPCQDTSDCDPYWFRFTPNTWPGFQFQVDPDHCVRNLLVWAIDKLPPSEVAWWTPTAPEQPAAPEDASTT